ncbi:MAG: DNA polymerase III subunit alpha [Gemmatimonadota bacterium]|nr:DNA polymerase III subunit alpha [Gemmatimonadota bacterium]
MKHCDFVHLHNHTEFSLLDGANRIRDLVARARECGMPALAITDHGAMHGCVEFYKEARKQGVKPILGCEVYITTGSRTDRIPTRGGGPRTHHLVLLARDAAGYRNLMKLTSAAYLEGFYYRPRIDHELLSRHSEGLIALTACLQGEVPSLLLEEKEDEALRILGTYQDMLGAENVYVEVQDHDIDEERRVIPMLRRIADRSGAKMVATNDCHYGAQSDAESHDILICIGTGKEFDDPKRLRMSTDQLYFKTADEMKELFRDIPEAVTNTLEVAERCNLELELGVNRMPRFPIPEGAKGEAEYLAGLAHEGMAARYPSADETVRKRLEYELGVITQMGYPGYFLIVRDFIHAAKDRGIPVGPGRGSAAGSLVAYCLEITDVDPIAHGLLFERFLNPERVSMPDIDIDFCYERRAEIIDYVVNKYGKESVSQIITFGCMAARAVIRDVGRVLKVPFGDVDRIAKMVPDDPDMTLAKAFSMNPDFERLERDDATFRRLVGHARVLEGLSRHASTHAAGVVVAPGDLTDFVPLFKSGRDEITTQYDMKCVEDVGLLKMDFLALRTLTVVQRALDMVNARLGQTITPAEIPHDDPATYELLASGETVGVFQLESGGMRSMLRSLRPTGFNDIVAVNALHRPGPLGAGMDKEFIDRKHGRREVQVLHPEMEPILRDTHGVILYQEQVMAIAARMAGFSLGEADLLRRAMGKKKIEEMDRQREKFVAGCVGRGIAEGVAGKVFDLMAHFAGYGFNKSHSVAYAVLSVQTAWLKANHPAEFLAATLTSEMTKSKRMPVLMEEARRMGLCLVPPDVNLSETGFIVRDGAIIFGMAAVKNVGVGAVERVLEIRSQDGEFGSLIDFVTRLDSKVLNRRVVESLVQAGALDSFGTHRAEVFEAVFDAMGHAARLQRERDLGQTSLFGEGIGDSTVVPFRDGLPEVEEWTKSDLLHREKAVLGFYFSGHPLSRWRREIRSFATARTDDLENRTDGTDMILGALVVAVRTKLDRRGNRMAFVELEDFTGTVEALVFSEPYRDCAETLAVDSMVLIGGTLSVKDEGEPKILLNRAMPLDSVAEGLTERIVLDVIDSEVGDVFVEKVKEIGRRRLGGLPTVLRVGLSDGNMVPVEVTAVRLRADEETLEELEGLVGENAVRLAGRWPAGVREGRRGRPGQR